MNIHLKIVNRSERRDVCFMLQLLCSVFWHAAWTHLYLACLPCHSPAQRSLCAQHHPTCYQPVLMNTHMRYLSRPACLHTGSCLGVCVIGERSPWLLFLSTCLICSFYDSSSGCCSLDVQRNNLVSFSACPLQSVWLVWQCSVAVVKKNSRKLCKLGKLPETSRILLNSNCSLLSNWLRRGASSSPLLLLLAVYINENSVYCKATQFDSITNCSPQNGHQVITSSEQFKH